MKIVQLFLVVALTCASNLQASESWLTPKRAVFIKNLVEQYYNSRPTLYIGHKLASDGQCICTYDSGGVFDCNKTDEENKQRAVFADKLRCVNAIKKMKGEQSVESMDLEEMDRFIDRVETEAMDACPRAFRT